MMHSLWNFQLLLVSPSIRSNRDHFLQADLSGTYVIVLLSFPLRPNVFDRATSGLHCRWHYWDSPGFNPYRNQLETGGRMSQVWLVTGSSRGLGRVIVEASLAAGNKVMATARNTESLNDLSDRYGAVILFNFHRWEQGSDLRVADPTRLQNGALKGSPTCCRA